MWPFSRFPSPAKLANEKCRWCPNLIGEEARYPIPLCDACYTMAWEDKETGTPKRTRMLEDFASEVREYFRLAMRRRA